MIYHRRKHSLIWNVIIVAGIICLLAANVMLFVLYTVSGERETEVEMPSEVTHRVLFLASYNPLYFTYDDQTLGLEEGLFPHGIEYDVVYLDSKLFPGEAEQNAFHDMLLARKQSTDRDYDAILTGDDAALQFAMSYKDELFEGLPIVFFGVNDLDLAQEAAADPMITGLFEGNYLEQTLSLAVALFPDHRNFVAVHDDSAAGEADREIFMTFAARCPDYSFSELDTQKMTHKELIDSLEALPSDSILIYMTCYTDAEGNVYSMREMTSTIAEHAATIPIFRNYVGGEGEGVLGGVALDFRAHTRLAGETVNEILEGRDVADIPLRMETPSRSVFDYRQVVAWGVDRSKMPVNTEYINVPVTFMDRYGPIMIPVGLMGAALLLFLAAAGLSAAEVKRSAAELKVSYDELERSQKILRYQAEHDDFLDIINRRSMSDFLHNEVDPADTFSIVMADLDGFKEINEDYGHRLSDDILKSITARLKELSDGNGWKLARYGGDEFLFFVPGERLTVDHPTTVKILLMFRMPVSVGDSEVSMSASLGISVSDGITSMEQHVTDAESAMYEAKHHGRDGAFLFADEMKEKVREENRIKGKLVDAFENDGFFMVYQPQINSQTKEVGGYEALVRMREPGIYPGQFIPIAEKNGWIWKIGRITTKLVVEQLAAWRDAGRELHPVSINYSSNQMNDTGYLDFLGGLLDKHGISPELIEIEITEGMFLDRTAQAENLFGRFKELGIRLLMDDFGTGYSSLGYLTYIPVDAIKLDKSLVDAYLVDGKDSFVRDVILLVHDLGKEIIIEGVEEERQFLRLREFGADTIQGYYFSKPLPAEDAINFHID